ncbi:augmin complex subunit dgt2 [Drosophila subobscura]|uniref:augmin complex subunit dgt2 n=1 Tax=Drosophila subobscura TaxID=7241 RepID=UPI00155AD1EA|nr:augmin complex subunit dgt2 [Drosophila subobscura]
MKTLPSTTIMSTDTKELLETRDNELKKVLQLKLLLDAMRRLDMGKNQSPGIKRALKLVSIGEFMRLGNDDGQQDYVLDLQEHKVVPALSYTDRKALRTSLTAKLQESLTPIAELGDQIREEFPEVFSKDVELNPGQKEIISLEVEHRASLEKKGELLSRKCALLNDAAELKMGPHLVNELQLKQASAEVTQTKAELLCSCFMNEIASRTEHSVKAIKEVEAHLDELLSAKNSATSTEKRAK